MTSTTGTVGARAVRRLAKDDLDAVVAIDGAATGRSRRHYFQQRLAAALREPDVHVQFAVPGESAPAGYVLARRLEGEFGRVLPALRLEAIGVAPAARGHGLGRALVDALAAHARAHGVTELRTTARWTDHDMLRFLAAEGFVLGGNQVVECAVHGGALGAGEGDSVSAPEYLGAGTEVDYSAGAANDFEALARDRCDVRSLAAADFQDIVRIDRGLTGRNRESYIRRKVDEALLDSAVRVSLTARQDGIVAGFVMAKVDFGDFGRTEAVAVIDTLGVDPEFAHHGVGHALMSQLFVNLAALRVERVETIVARENFDLLGFLYDLGFEASQRLGFVRRLDARRS
jgi:ribosomal protein S18 acetylase RimI-like enzyme